MKRNKLDLLQHVEIGRDLHEMQDYLSRLQVILGNAYSQKESNKQMRLLQRIKVELSQLRSLMDDRVYYEYRYLESVNRLNKVYYPGSNQVIGELPKTPEKN